jgi:hypothetical protein
MKTETAAALRAPLIAGPLLALLIGGPLPAQDAPVAENATPPPVEAAPLDAPNLGAAGLLPPAVTGLPTSLWQGSDPAVLTTLIAALDLSVPVLRAQMRALMLAEADPPLGDSDLAHLTARLDWLVDAGAVEEARALLDVTGVEDPRLFRVWADLGLLLGRSEPVCAALARSPRLSRDIPLRIFCTARDGDWTRAAHLLRTAEALEDLPERQAALLTRFLDPEIGEEGALLPPVRPSPLEFRLFEAIGEPLPTAPLPLPFAVLDLGGDNGWRDQIQAAERLARAGSLSPNRLLGIYSLREPAASGGLWDRVAALQAFEAALERGAPDTVGSTLRLVWPQMASAGLLVPFAQLYAEPLAGIEGLDPVAARLVARAAFLSPAYEALLPKLEAETPETAFLSAIARGEMPLAFSDLPHAEAVAEGFGTAAQVPAVLTEQLAQGRLGEVILRAMALFASGAAGNGDDLSDALATLRAVGLEDTARRAALELMLLDAERARR